MVFNSTIKKHSIFSCLYFLIVIANVLIQLLDMDLIKILAVPLIGITLIGYFIFSTKLKGNFNKRIFSGLVLALAADVQFLFSNDGGIFLAAAIAAISLGYIIYGIAFYFDYKHNLSLYTKDAKQVFLCISAISILYYIFIRGELGDYKIPVMIHVFILSFLPMLAACRYNRVNLLSYQLMMAGSVCFVISDYSLGYTNFVAPHKGLSVLFIVAYTLAQYFIVIGAIERRLRRKVQG